MVVAGRVRCTGVVSELWTIGHWTPREVFLSPLLREGIDLVVDVRAQPGSRRSPQFGRDELPGWLSEAGIGYVQLAELGGRRPKQPVDADVNGGWKNASFHNDADYTLGDDYRVGIERLEALGREKRVVLLCGEPMPWRCHRSRSPTPGPPAAGPSGTSSETRRQGATSWVRGDQNPSGTPTVASPIRPFWAGRTAHQPHSDARAERAHPRVLGDGIFRTCTHRRQGLTPACAGTAPGRGRSSTGPRAHPRVCGDGARFDSLSIESLGSPPPVRGRRGHPL